MTKDILKTVDPLQLAKMSAAKVGPSLSKMPINKLTSAIASVDPLTWGMTYRRIRGRRYGFWISEEEKQNPNLWRYHRPQLAQPLADLRKAKVILKSRQCGISENGLTEAGWFCDQHQNAKVVYTFPREKQVIRFVGTRVEPFLKETPYLEQRAGAGRSSTFLKQIGSSFLIFESAWSEELGEGIDADVLFLDEKDRMRPGVEFAFKESMSSSNYGWVRYISTPTIPNKGVDEYWQRSDQHYWMIKCEGCGKWQTMTYPDNFQQIKSYQIDAKILPPDSWQYICKYCKQPKLDRWRGFWYKTKKDVEDIAGYHINQAMCVWITATEIMQKMVEYKYKNVWYNYVMGRPYRSDDDLVGQHDFDSCYANSYGWTFQGMRPRGINRVSIGIDWGDLTYIVVWGRDANRKRYLLAAYIIQRNAGGLMWDAREAARIADVFKADIIIADSGYAKDGNDYLQRRFPGRFYANFHPRTPVGSKIYQPKWSETVSRVDTDKTLILKDACRIFKEHDRTVIPQPDGPDEMKSFVEHHMNLVLTIEEDEGGTSRDTQEYERVSNVGADHFALASAYSIIGMNRYDYEGGGGFDFEFI